MMHDDLLSNPYWHALKTEQESFALGTDIARRYPRDVIPFAGLVAPTTEAMASLAWLLERDEAIYVTGERLPKIETLAVVGELPGWQMLFPEGDLPGERQRNNGGQIEALDGDDAAAMLALTEVAFPGFFRLRTFVLGRYYGVYSGGELVAMAGERIALPGWREISAVCTHPHHTGKGHAAALIGHLLHDHKATGLRSLLHVSAANHRALELYRRLGFVTRRRMHFNLLRRV